MLSLKVFDRNLSIHHINYNKKDCKPKNIILTCNSCNAKANFNREKWERYYTSIIESGERKNEILYSS